MSNEVAKYEGNPQALISLAIEKGADPAFLSRLLDVQERWQANIAKSAYVSAMTAFKREAPAVLKKVNRVFFETGKGQTNYRYANLGSIIQEISAILGKHELSASWETSQSGNNITVICHITHVAGHTESVTLSGPADQTGNKNAIQAVGSTVTYLQRYTLLAALGLATGEDNDGQGNQTQGKPNVEPPQAKSAPTTPGTVTAVIDIVEVKTGTKDGKEWTKYGIHCGETVYGTFDKKIADAATTLTGCSALITFEQKGKFLTITAVSPDEEREPGQDG